MDYNPKTQGKVHPEQKDDEVFRGNFDTEVAGGVLARLPSSRAGNTAFDKDGCEYPKALTGKYRPVPVFQKRSAALGEHYGALYDGKSV